VRRNIYLDAKCRPDGRLLVVPGEENPIELFSAESGTLLRTMSGDARAMSFAFSDQLLCMSDLTGANTLVDITTGSELLRVIRFAGDDDWIAVTPEGLFDGTENARKRVFFRIGNSNQLVNVDRFFQDYYCPGLIRDILRGERPMPAASSPARSRRW